MSPAGSPQGGSLVEVVVALVVFQVGLLGAAGLLVLASGVLARAVELERAAAEVAWVADSLSRARAEGRGERSEGAWRVTWQAEGGGLVVRAALAGGEPPTSVFELWVP